MAKLKVGQRLAKNVVALPKNVGLASDNQFMLDGYTKVRFPPNAYAKVKVQDQNVCGLKLLMAIV